MRAPRSLFSRMRISEGSRRRGLIRFGAALALMCQAVPGFAADPFLDENGYFWSSTEKDGESPVIWDRAILQYYTDGTWRWSITDAGKVYEKIATGSFYDLTRNPGLNELAQAVATMRAANQATEAGLEQSLRQEARPADTEAANRLEALIVRLRRGEKGEAVQRALAEFVDETRATALLAERDKARQSAFELAESVYQRQRLNMAMASAQPVRTMVVSERSRVVPANTPGGPLDIDDGAEGFSDALGFPYRLVPAGDGNFYAIVQNKPQPGSAADQLQLLMGDAVTAINDRPIRTPADLERMTQPQTIVTVAKQLDGTPVRQLVDFAPGGARQTVPPGYQILPPGYRYVR